jgi:hypothetical protein
MEFYSADFEMLMSGWNTLYLIQENANELDIHQAPPDQPTDCNHLIALSSTL